jgi:hypothetical protein
MGLIASDDAASIDVTPGEVKSWDGTPAYINAEGIAEVAPLPVGYDPNHPSRPYVIARLEVDEFKYEFVRLYTTRVSDGSNAVVASIAMRTLGPVNGPNPALELQNSSDVALTFAEIYTGLTGETAPSELLEEHGWQANRLVRDSDFRHAERRPLAVQKTTDAEFTPDIPGHHWEFPTIKTLTFCSDPFDLRTANCEPSDAIVSKYWCTMSSRPGPDGYGVPEAINCPVAVWGHTGWVRSAFYVPVGDNVIWQECYGPVVGDDWACYPAFAVNGSLLYVVDWDVPERKIIGMVLSRSEVPSTTARGRIFSGIAAAN